MKNNSLIIGSHISVNKKNNYLLGAVQETVDNGANCFMIFTGAPQNKKRVPIKELFLTEALELASSKKIDFQNSVVHAPYIINLATNKTENIEFFCDLLVLEIQRSVDIGIKYIVLHPGFHTNQTLQEGIDKIVKNLKNVLERTHDLDYFICLETMAGKTNQIGKTLEEIKSIMDGCDNHPKLAVCLDTCHMHDSGYDLKDKDKFLNFFNSLIPISKIKVIHIGDSSNVMGSKKDVHANLDYGYIGFDTLLSWVYDPYISTIPIIVETPFWHKFVNNKKILVSPYKHEISLIKNKKWLPIQEKDCFPRFNKQHHPKIK